jgi:hypothetical protein
MRENEKLEEIFDRYVGLELLNRDWTHAPGAAGRSGRSADHARAAAWEFSSQFREEPLPPGVAGGTE